MHGCFGDSDCFRFSWKNTEVFHDAFYPVSYTHLRTEVECQSWRDCVKACGDLLVAEGKIEPSFIDSMIQTVEELGPYMILIPKVAFFHGRPSEAVHKACLSLITLKDSVRFEEFEGQEISCAFGFGAVDADSHVNMLVKVEMCIRDSR